MPMAVAERVRQHRDRQRSGKVLVTLELEEDLIINALRSARLLDPNKETDKSVYKAGSSA
jgi:hypothetical protein